MNTGAAKAIGIQDIQERLERDKALNIKLTGAVAGVWFLLVNVVSLLNGGGNIVIAFLTALYHFGWGFYVVRHIFNYALPKATRLEIFTKWVKDYWRWYVIGLVAVLLFYPAFWLGTIASLILGSVAVKKLTISLAEEYHSGSRPMLFHWLQQDYSQKLLSGDKGIFFGGLMMPSSEATTHIRLTGGSGSGKTNLLRLYMQSVLPQIVSEGKGRALIHDPKTEFLPVIAGMGVPQEKVILLNPFDDRAYAWDLAKDLTRDRDANELANLLLPDKPGGQGDNEFFSKAAKRILAGVTRFFMRSAPGAWTLRDLVLAAQHLELITLLLSQDKSLKRSLQVLGSGDTVGNVMSTLAAYIGDGLETVAAHCDYHMRAGRVFTLSEWIEGNHILVLGCDRESEATLQPLNQLLFTRASQMLLTRETEGTTYMILDELPAMGKLNKIDQVAELGRSYGVSLTTAFQSYSKLEHIYGEKIANALMGQFDKAAYLRTKDKPTAQWASEQIGDMKVVWKARSQSQTQGQMPMSGSQTHGTGEQRDSNPVARPDDFMNMPKPDKPSGTGVNAFYRIDNHVYRHEVSSDFLSQHLKSEASQVDKFVDVSELADELRLWDEEDIYRLGIHQVLAELDGERFKSLPVDDWVELPPIYSPLSLGEYSEEEDVED